jgi:ubiquinol-cytochrome c reductase cytochrome b subunit
MTYDQIVRQVVQGGGNMPAYGNALNANETTALVGFLRTLNGKDMSPAIDASRSLTHTSEVQPPPKLQPGHTE